MKPTNNIDKETCRNKHDHDVAENRKPVNTAEITKWVKATVEALETFDFDECAEYYKKLDWAWDYGKHNHIPNVDDIKDEVVKMISTCIDGVVAEEKEKCSYNCSYGGLAVRAFKDPDPQENWIWIGFVPVETIY